MMSQGIAEVDERNQRMRKKELEKMFVLQPTSEIRKKASLDIPVQKTEWGRKKDVYQYDIYMNIKIQGTILHASFFPTRGLRLGSNKPLYQVFIDKAARTFVTWDAVYEKWREAKLDRLVWPDCGYSFKTYISSKENKRMKKFLEVIRDGYNGILDLQRAIREEQLYKRHKKETDPWDKLMEQIPSRPDDWNHWVDKKGIPQNYIFYEYSRKKKQEGYCGWCEKMVPVEHPRHNQMGKCPCCGNEIQYKAIGKMAGRFQTDRKTVHLIQQCQNGLVVCMFEARRWYQKENFKNPKITCYEERRVFYNSRLEANPFYYGLYKQVNYRWIQGYPREWCLFGYYIVRNDVGRVYPGTLPKLEENGLDRTGMTQMLEWKQEINPESYLDALQEYPFLEQFAKAGLNRLAEDVYLRSHELELGESPDLAKRLGIDRMRMKRLKDLDGGCHLLGWLRYEKRREKCFPDSILQYFIECDIKPDEISFIEDQMSPVRIKNYLDRQEGLSGRKAKELLSTWQDYLFMAGRMNMDTCQEVIYKPRDIVKSHDAAVSAFGGVKMMKRAEELLRTYPEIEMIYHSIKDKYEFGNKKYRIVVPEKIEDILQEGYALGHCLDRSDIYFDRIQRRESFIVFLRKAQKPEQPYYTLEIEPDGTARQKRTVGDKQNVDFDEAKGFILKWQRAIRKNLSKEDLLLAKESARLRAEEFKELRENGTKIWHGHLAGKLLADVLEADLMEAALCAENVTEISAIRNRQELPAAA